MTDQDPDAIWRPGYTGPVMHRRPETSPPAIERAVPPEMPVVVRAPTNDASIPQRRHRWLGLAVGLVAVIAGVSVLVSVAGDGGPPPSTLDRVPPTAQQRWSVTLDAPAVSMVSGSADVLVLVPDGPRREVVALDVNSGAERWRARLPRGQVDVLEVLGDVVVSSTVAPGGDQTVQALDARSGRQRWSATVTDEDRAMIEDGQLVVVRAGGPSGPAFELLDAATGDVASSIVGGELSWTRSGLQRREGGRIEVFERRTFHRAGVIDLVALSLSPTSFARAASTDAGIVLATPNAVMLVGADNMIRSTIERAPSGTILPVTVDVLDDAGRFVAVQRGDELVLLSTHDGELRELWTESAWLMDWHIDADRQLVARASLNGSVVTMPPQIVDAETGETLWDGPSAVQRSSPFRVFSANGFIGVEAPSSPGARTDVVGYDLDRTERWRRPIGVDTTAVLVDDGLVTIDRETVTGTTTLTLFS